MAKAAETKRQCRQGDCNPQAGLEDLIVEWQQAKAMSERPQASPEYEKMQREAAEAAGEEHSSKTREPNDRYPWPYRRAPVGGFKRRAELKATTPQAEKLRLHGHRHPRMKDTTSRRS